MENHGTVTGRETDSQSAMVLIKIQLQLQTGYVRVIKSLSVEREFRTKFFNCKNLQLAYATLHRKLKSCVRKAQNPGTFFLAQDQDMLVQQINSVTELN